MSLFLVLDIEDELVEDRYLLFAVHLIWLFE